MKKASRKTLDKLPAWKRGAIAADFRRGYTVDEIRRGYGLPAATVEAVLRKALR